MKTGKEDGRKGERQEDGAQRHVNKVKQRSSSGRRKWQKRIEERRIRGGEAT